MVWRGTAAFALLASGQVAVAVADPPSDETLLVCDGTSRGNQVTSRTTGSMFDNRGNSATGYAVTTEPGTVAFRVQLRIKDGKAEMNTPPGPSPWWGGGKAGWYPVKGLAITGDEISGRVQYNFATASRFRIDRRTGTITTDKFTGTCVKQDLSQRAF